MKYLYVFIASIFLTAPVFAVDIDVPQVPIKAPPFPQREVPKTTIPFPGKSLELQDGTTKFTLFIPDAWHAPESGEIPLTVQFHCGTGFAIEEHLRHGLKTPLLVANLGNGSSKYRVPFEDRERLKRWMALALKSLPAQGTNSHVTVLDICSFSAGYGAVREIIKSPEYFKLIRRVILSDSMYAGLQNTNAGAVREPSHENIEAWIPLAQAAVRGEKTFAFTHSQVPTDYATTGECAAALIKIVKAPIVKIPAGSTPAASDPNFPLQYQSDLGNFHIWGYGGTDGAAHLTQVRHFADVWMVLDAAKNL